MSDDEIDELTEDDTGRYRVHAHSSYHDFDLDLRTVTRFRGPTAPLTTNDCQRTLRTIAECKIGRFGRWTMSSSGYLDPIDYFWQQTSIIRKIERLDDDEDAGADAE
jgi:hypothetical protein